MNFFQRRKLKKAVHHMLHVAKHARHMREDIARPEEIQAVMDAEKKLSAAWSARDPKACDAAAEVLNTAVEKIYPTTKDAGWRENVEVFAVALAVAMAFRTYLLQPFKIPTNSMFPTLYGITYKQDQRDTFDIFPLSILRWCVSGESFVDVRAEADGYPRVTGKGDDYWVVVIGDKQHKLPLNETLWTIGRDHRGDFMPVTNGQMLATGRRRLGDHIFVNRVAYNFKKPERGDIFVFSTEDVKYSGVMTNDFYIKRLVGLPNDELRLQPPHILADGNAITNGPFAKLFSKEGEYLGIGYEGPGDWRDALAIGRPLKLSATQYLPCGDNTRSSLDGRYFGPIEQKRVVGPACFIYWPFGKRWGIPD